MWGYSIYGFVAFLITVLIQFIEFKTRKDPNKKWGFWTGASCLVIICILGIVSQDVRYFASLIGFAAGGSVGEIMKWH